MKNFIFKIIELIQQCLEVLCTIQRLIAAHKASHEFSARDTGSDDKVVHVTAEWIMNFLDIPRSNFYRNVHKKTIEPAFYVGRRPYYLKRDVESLWQPHEPGAHTFSKIWDKQRNLDKGK